MSPFEERQFSTLSFLSHRERGQRVRIRRCRLCQSSLQLGTAAVRCLCAGAPLQGAQTPRGDQGAQMLPGAELSCPSLHTSQLLRAGPGGTEGTASLPAERGKESKVHTRNSQGTKPRAMDLRPVQLLMLQGTNQTAPLQVKLK